MQILNTDADLVALLTPAEKDAYIGPQSKMFDQVDIVSETISMNFDSCLLYTSPSPRDGLLSRMPSSA